MSSSGKGLGSPMGKKIMGYAYGIGASVVIIGALFKILHLPGASLMLTLGMGTEAILFFLGSFEPAHQDPTHWDWTQVYPSLTPLKSDDEKAAEKKAGITSEEDATTTAAPQATVAATSAAPIVVANGLSDEDMKKWDESITKISKTADNLSKLSEVGKVSESYIGKLSNAADAAENLGKAQNDSAELISTSSKQVADNYKTSTEKFDLTISAAAEQLKDGMSTASDKLDKSITETANTLNSNLSTASSDAADTISKASSTLATGYKNVTDALSKKLEVIETSTSESGKELKSVSKNLAAINSVYELQLNAINDELKIKEAQKETQSSVNDQLSLIQKAVSEAVIANEAYKSESTKLQSTITELNNVYGNMLNSLNS